MKIADEKLREFRDDFNMAMESLREKYDVTIELGRITYYTEDERFSAKLEVKNGRDKDLVERADFDANVWKFEHLGLTRGMYGRIGIGKDGERYALVGFNTRAKKYPFHLVNMQDGSRIRSGEYFIKEFLNEYYTSVEVLDQRS